MLYLNYMSIKKKIKKKKKELFQVSHQMNKTQQLPSVTKNFFQVRMDLISSVATFLFKMSSFQQIVMGYTYTQKEHVAHKREKAKQSTEIFVREPRCWT